MPKGSLNVSLKGADDIFSTEVSRQEQQREQVQQIPIGELFHGLLQAASGGGLTPDYQLISPDLGIPSFFSNLQVL